MMLRHRGLYTGAVVDDGHSEMLQPATGLDGGFVSFREVDNAPLDRHNDMGTTDMAIINLRNMYLDATRTILEGGEPWLPTDMSAFEVRSVSAILDRDVPFLDGLQYMAVSH